MSGQDPGVLGAVVVAVLAGGAGGGVLWTRERSGEGIGSGRVVWAFGGAVLVIAALTTVVAVGDGADGLVVAAAGLAALVLPTGAWAAAGSARDSLRAAAVHQEAVTRSHIASDRLHTRFGEHVDDVEAEQAARQGLPQIAEVVEAARSAERAITPAVGAGPGVFVSRRWRQRGHTVERYHNPLDVPRTWHDPQIERLTLLVTFSVRALLVLAGPCLGASVSYGQVADLGDLGVGEVLWAAYLAVSVATLLCAPGLAQAMMDPSRGRLRGRLGTVELVLGLVVVAVLPSWLLAAAVLSSVLNLWNRAGPPDRGRRATGLLARVGVPAGYSWRYKVPAGCLAVAVALEGGLLLAGSSAEGLLIEFAAAGGTLLVMSSSYGVWWPFSGAVLLGTPLQRARGARRGVRHAAGPLGAFEAAAEAAEVGLGELVDAGREEAFEWLCLLRRAVRAYGQVRRLPEQIESIALALLPPQDGLGELESIRLHVDAELSGRRFRDADSRVCFAGAVELLGGEAVRHGAELLTVTVSSDGRQVLVAAVNGIRRPPRPGRGRGSQRLEQFVEGLEGRVGGPATSEVTETERWTAGFSFPREVLR